MTFLPSTFAAQFWQLDLSKNKIQSLGNISQLKELKSFNCDENILATRSLFAISKLSTLTTLSLGKNRLSNLPTSANQTFPTLPPKVKQLKLHNNSFSSIPKQICDPKLPIEKLDLSFNNLASIPPEISNLGELTGVMY